MNTPSQAPAMSLSLPPTTACNFALTEAQIALLPTEDDVRFYQEHGWYISRPIFSDAQLDATLAGSERFYAGERDWVMPDGTPDFLYGWRGNPGLRKNDYASLVNRELHALVHHPLIGAIAACLAGVPVIRLWHDQLLYKPSDDPACPANVGWHTDRGYWKTCSSVQMLTCWIPFHDCDAAMGTVSMVDGSNQWPDNTTALNFFSNDLDGLEQQFVTGGKPVVKTPMTLKKGQASFHSCLTIHGSGPNRTEKPRRSLAVHLQDGDNHWREERYPNGTLAQHFNDTLVRKTEAGFPDYSDPRVCPVLWDATALGAPEVR